MTNTDREPEPLTAPDKPKKKRALAMPRLALAAALLAAGGIGAGAGVLSQRNHPQTWVELAPVPVTAMKAWSQVAVKGQVAEVFGNKFILTDDSGRALIETGPKGDDGDLVAKDETVIVQGRFEHGFVHAVAIQHADGKTVFLGPPGPPRPPRGPLSQ